MGVVVNKKTVFSGLVWRFLERIGAQSVTLIVSIVLARLLDPVVFGVVAIVTVINTILQVFVDGGFSASLIQKKDSDDLDFSTVFYFNIVVCLALYGIVFLIAPLIASFYENEQLTDLIRVLSLIVVISGFSSIQITYASKHMQFKKFFLATIIGTIISAFVGIFMAYRGFGVWALVFQTLTNNFIDAIILWVVVRWKPKKMFSFKRLKSLFSYGWKLLVAALVDTSYNGARSLIIGKKYSAEDLAYYNKGKQFPDLIVTNINTSISTVLFPAFSQLQDDKASIKAAFKRALQMSVFVIAPMMVGMAVCGDSLIRVLLTDKWEQCIPYLQIICLSYVFYPVVTVNMNALKSIGKSNVFLIVEITKKLIGIILILIAMWISVKAIVYSLALVTIISVIIGCIVSKKYFNYGFFEQIKDIGLILIISFIMGALVYFIGFINGPSIMTLVKQVLFGIVVYFGLSMVLRVDSFKYFTKLVSSYIKKQQ